MHWRRCESSWLYLLIGGQRTRARFLSAENAPSSLLLSGPTSEKLELCQLKQLLVNSVFEERELSKDEVFLEYSNVFTGFGGTFSTFANPIIHFFYPPPPPSKFCLMIVFDFSWNMKMTQGKSKTMAMQIFWGVKEVYYGIELRAGAVPKQDAPRTEQVCESNKALSFG